MSPSPRPTRPGRPSEGRHPGAAALRLAALCLAVGVLATAGITATDGFAAAAEDPSAAVDADGAVVSARVAGDGTVIELKGRAGVASYGIDAWRAWADAHLAGAVAGPLAIGPVDIGVDDFRRFGVAVASPDGGRVLFSATTYAMLTTLSLVGVLDVGSEEVALLPEPRMGDLEAVTWSPHGDHVAYALGTARSGGEALHVDAVDGTPTSVVALSGADLHAAWLGAGLPVVAVEDARRYMPRFRDLAWTPDGRRLRFTVDAPGTPFDESPPAPARPCCEEDDGAGPVRWSIAVDGSGLAPVTSSSADDPASP